MKRLRVTIPGGRAALIVSGSPEIVLRDNPIVQRLGGRFEITSDGLLTTMDDDWQTWYPAAAIQLVRWRRAGASALAQEQAEAAAALAEQEAQRQADLKEKHRLAKERREERRALKKLQAEDEEYRKNRKPSDVGVWSYP